MRGIDSIGYDILPTSSVAIRAKSAVYEYDIDEIPVDFISSSLAEQFGFEVEKIYCLKQQKGNSSQQMAKFGRVPLRKSITIWRKPQK